MLAAADDGLAFFEPPPLFFAAAAGFLVALFESGEVGVVVRDKRMTLAAQTTNYSKYLEHNNIYR